MMYLHLQSTKQPLDQHYICKVPIVVVLIGKVCLHFKIEMINQNFDDFFHFNNNDMQDEITPQPDVNLQHNENEIGYSNWQLIAITLLDFSSSNTALDDGLVFEDDFNSLNEEEENFSSDDLDLFQINDVGDNDDLELEGETVNFTKMFTSFNHGNFFELLKTLFPPSNLVNNQNEELNTMTFDEFLNSTVLLNNRERLKTVLEEKHYKIEMNDYRKTSNNLVYSYDIDSAIWIGNSLPNSDYENLIYFPFPDLRSQMFKDNFLSVTINGRKRSVNGIPNIQIGKFGIGGENRIFMFLPSLMNQEARGITRETMKTFYNNVAKRALFESSEFRFYTAAIIFLGLGS